MIYIYSWNTAIVTTTQMIRRSIQIEIYKLRSMPSHNMMAILKNLSVDKIKWRKNYEKNYMYDHRNPSQNQNIQPLLTLKVTKSEMLIREITGCKHRRKLRWTDHIDHLCAITSSKIHYCDNFLHISQMMLKKCSTKGIFYH